ncbi:hypothetical protein AaE_010516 [Aphanomyces astaci]|uniref:Uncharacterized protein n=1 Tax=Aphanomyces astaci TaxID=112090 RepID=A0A6A4ZTT1_APHAT|nr:hypothetical protein AaE_010516 [Aphanomyces astaci]
MLRVAFPQDRRQAMESVGDGDGRCCLGFDWDCKRTLATSRGVTNKDVIMEPVDAARLFFNDRPSVDSDGCEEAAAAAMVDEDWKCETGPFEGDKYFRCSVLSSLLPNQPIKSKNDFHWLKEPPKGSKDRESRAGAGATATDTLDASMQLHANAGDPTRK